VFETIQQVLEDAAQLEENLKPDGSLATRVGLNEEENHKWREK
jgi:hypothetical protein